MYDKILIPLCECKSEDDLIEYLYKHHYNEILHVNENGSISYYIDKFDNNKLYAITDLCAYFEIWCITDDCESDLTLSDILKVYKTLKTKKFKIYDKKEILQFKIFKNIINFLSDWSGEYMDSIFDIIKNKDNWIINCRIELDL